MRLPSTPYRSRRRALGALGLALSLTVAVAGCGSSSDDGAAPDTTAATGTTAGSTPADTTAGTSPAGPEVPAAAALTVEDLGPNWAVYPESAPTHGDAGSATRCSAQAGAPDGSRLASPTFQRGTQIRYFRSTAWELPDEAAATALVAALNTPEARQCEQAKIDESIRAAGDQDSTTEIIDVQEGDPETGLAQSYNVIQRYAPTGEEPGVVAVRQFVTLRSGTTVVMTLWEDGETDDTEADAAFAEIQAAVNTLMGRLG